MVMLMTPLFSAATSASSEWALKKTTVPSEDQFGDGDYSGLHQYELMGGGCCVA